MSFRTLLARLVRRRPPTADDPAAVARQAIAAMRKDKPKHRDRSGSDYREPDPSQFIGYGGPF